MLEIGERNERRLRRKKRSRDWVEAAFYDSELYDFPFTRGLQFPEIERSTRHQCVEGQRENAGDACREINRDYRRKISRGARKTKDVRRENLLHRNYGR